MRIEADRVMQRGQWTHAQALLVALVLQAPVVLRAQSTSALPRKFASPADEGSAEDVATIDRAAALLNAHARVEVLLTDPHYAAVRPYPRFRALIQEHADDRPLTTTTPDEPGEALFVDGALEGSDGRPMVGALVYVYHTSASGCYADSAIHISGQSGDERFARLFAYLRTDVTGHFHLRTIRPAGYPSSELPAHLHLEFVSADGRERQVTEVVLGDDLRLTPDARARAARDASHIVQPVRRQDGFHVTERFVVRVP